MPQKTKKNKNKSSKLKPGVSLVIKVLLIVFVAIMLIFFAARMLGGITLTSAVENIRISISNLGAGDGYPYTIEGSAVKEAFTDSSNLFAFSEDKTLLLSSSAKELSVQTIEYGSPAIDVKNDKALVYDRDSGQYRVQNLSKTVIKSEINNTITCGAIGKKGNFALSSVTSNNQTVFTAFNKSNEQIFTWNLSGEFVTSIDLSDDGKYAVVGTIMAKNAATDSKVYVFRFDNEKEYVSCFDYPENVVVSVRYLNSHNIEVITDKQRSYIEDNVTKESDYKFNSNILHDISAADERYSAVSYLKYGSDSNVILDVFNKDKKLYTVDLNCAAKAISNEGKYTGVLTDNKALIYNKKGELIKEIPVEASSTDIVISNKKVYIITPIKIICESF